MTIEVDKTQKAANQVIQEIGQKVVNDMVSSTQKTVNEIRNIVNYSNQYFSDHHNLFLAMIFVSFLSLFFSGYTAYKLFNL